MPSEAATTSINISANYTLTNKSGLFNMTVVFVLAGL